MNSEKERARRDRALKAVALRDGGLTYREIGATFGVGRGRGFQLVRHGERIRKWGKKEGEITS